ncbi:dienelactone hydrolase family protein [Sphingomonas sp. SUN039]|uniref:dienelactone hydrolase family protein n=1 Tax=Sphingomonas sp. SUN039 TaxID=2937787 RepID=UPI0021646579|nr:dienelactone hydrolase family protein [Sphingomonas sp. SUN039]UVO52603.1 dienelactone hydrolase family protein [Sphingomonas sp. SUN039]
MADRREPLTAQDFPREVLTLFDKYVHGGLSRRGFLDQCAAHVGTMAAASGILAALAPDFASAQVVPLDDKRIGTSKVEIASAKGSGSISAYVAKPAKSRGRKPVVLVVHENRGLNPHIEDIARRLAVDGFIAIAPDALTKLGGYPGDEDKARALFGQLDQAKIREDFLAAAAYALALPGGNGKLGAVGFCYGGGVVNMLATKLPALRAGVPFYGAPAPLDGVPAIKAELLIQMAGNDTRINGLWPTYETALKAAGVKYQAHIYPGVEHGFNNNTTPRFDKDAAALAWARTLALFKRTLV